MAKKRKLVIAVWILAIPVFAYVVAFVVTLGCNFRFEHVVEWTKWDRTDEYLFGLSVCHEQWPLAHKQRTVTVLPGLLRLHWIDFPIRVNIQVYAGERDLEARHIRSFTVRSLEVSVNGQKQVLRGPTGQAAGLTFPRNGSVGGDFFVHQPNSTIRVRFEGDAVKEDGSVVPCRVTSEYRTVPKTRFYTGRGELLGAG